jgi:hypothetical protein
MRCGHKDQEIALGLKDVKVFRRIRTSVIGDRRYKGSRHRGSENPELLKLNWGKLMVKYRRAVREKRRTYGSGFHQRFQKGIE